MSRSRPLLAGVAVVAALLGVLAIAQLLLPAAAARRLRSRLAADGVVQSVNVRAFPAVELLWGRADSVTVHFASLTATRARTGDLLGRAHQTGALYVTVTTLTDGPVRLRDVSVRKHGNELDARATLAQADLRSALPAGFAVQPVASGNGELELRAQASLFGLGFSVNALLAARNGALVIVPVGIPFGSLATFTVFSDPHLVVEGVGATPQPGGYAISAVGRLPPA